MSETAIGHDARSAGTRAFPVVSGVTVEHRWVRARGLRFHVALAGPPDSPPLVLLHGWPQHWYAWRKVLPALAEHRRVICPDLRGLGWSDAPPGGYEKEHLAGDVLALLDALGVGRAHLMAHDWGGWVGFLLVLREPERFGRYVALNIPPPWRSRDPAPRDLLDAWRLWYQVVLASPLGPRLVARRDLVIRMLRADNVHQDTFSDEAAASFADALAEPARAAASREYYRSFLHRELRELARGRYDDTPLRTPTLLLFGTGDRAISARAVRDAARPGDPLTVELVEDSGHFVAEERPDLVAERALAWFGG